MDLTEQLLQVSAKLYQLLTTIPKGEERDRFIDEINVLLDERGKIIETLRQQNFQINTELKSHAMLVKLDHGIRERLQLVMEAVKKDMRDLQNAKRNEHQYMNPYSKVRVMDGMYYDKKQ